jgi:hypothetical protein
MGLSDRWSGRTAERWRSQHRAIPCERSLNLGRLSPAPSAGHAYADVLDTLGAEAIRLDPLGVLLLDQLDQVAFEREMGLKAVGGDAFTAERAGDKL